MSKYLDYPYDISTNCDNIEITLLEKQGDVNIKKTIIIYEKGTVIWDLI